MVISYPNYCRRVVLKHPFSCKPSNSSWGKVWRSSQSKIFDCFTSFYELLRLYFFFVSSFKFLSLRFSSPLSLVIFLWIGFLFCLQEWSFEGLFKRRVCSFGQEFELPNQSWFCKRLCARSISPIHISCCFQHASELLEWELCFHRVLVLLSSGWMSIKGRKDGRLGKGKQWNSWRSKTITDFLSWTS